MSKMRMPEMSVVRFNESDVIVASRNYLPPRMEMRNFNDATKDNGVIIFDDQSYSYNNRGIGNTFLFNDLYSGYSIATQSGDGALTFASIVEAESRNPLDGIGPTNGYYEWNPATSTYDYSAHQ